MVFMLTVILPWISPASKHGQSDLAGCWMTFPVGYCQQQLCGDSQDRAQQQASFSSGADRFVQVWTWSCHGQGEISHNRFCFLENNMRYLSFTGPSSFLDLDNPILLWAPSSQQWTTVRTLAWSWGFSSHSDDIRVPWEQQKFYSSGGTSKHMIPYN